MKKDIKNISGIGEEGRQERGTKKHPDMTDIAYLGPEATFTHQATLSFFGNEYSLKAVDSIEDVFDRVERGVSHRGVVPIENSYEGSVNSTLDLFYQYDLKICGEIINQINHHIMSKARHLKDVKRLYSHPMAIAQCRSWIKSHMSGVKMNEVVSTAYAAQKVVFDTDSAAIGSRLAAETYDLNILEECVEDAPNNFTRFLVLGKDRSKITGRDKTSILISLYHKPGALYQALGALAERGINMTRIESRPMKTKNWEYLFFIDFEGHENERDAGMALTDMQEHCIFIKRLGSYPVWRDS